MKLMQLARSVLIGNAISSSLGKQICFDTDNTGIYLWTESLIIDLSVTTCSEVSGDREVQRTMLELLNQLDGFSSDERIKV